MAHHGNGPFDGDDEQIRQKIADTFDKIMREPLIGATGLHPKGKLTKSDEGGIQFAVLNRDGKVVMDFGQSTRWIGMDPQDAADLATALLRQARIAAKKTGEPITVELG